jgi:hypothetical protein
MDDADSEDEELEVTEVENSEKRPSIIAKNSVERLKKASGIFSESRIDIFLPSQDLDVHWNLPEGGAPPTGEKKPLQRRMASLDKLPNYQSLMRRRSNSAENLELEEQTEEREEVREANVAKVAPLSRTISSEEPPDSREEEKMSEASRSMSDVTDALSSESEGDLVRKVAARFVAAILAGAMAEHIRSFHDNPQQNQIISTAEVN